MSRICLPATWVALALAAFCAVGDRTGGAADQQTGVAPADRPPFRIGYRLLAVPGGRQEPLVVALWYPTETGPGSMAYGIAGGALSSDATPDAPPARGPFPLVVFSHGAGGCAVQGAAFAEALAEYGFVVAGPDHTDEFTVGRSDGSSPPDPQRVREWLDWAGGVSEAGHRGRAGTRFAHRPREVRMTIDYLLQENANAGSGLEGLLDPERIGAMGVSFGGWTTQAVAGFVPLYRDERIRAAVPIAGPVGPSVGSFASIRIPVMIVFGEEETVVLRNPTSPRKTAGMERHYASANPPRYLVGIAGARHMDFGGAGRSGRRDGVQRPSSSQVRTGDPVIGTVNRHCLAFFRRYLKDDPSASRLLTERGPNVFMLEADDGEAPGALRLP